MAQDAINQQPVIFLSEGSRRTRGRDAQRINIMIAKAIANAVKSTLGPKGMDKMIVDDLGDVTISNDGATILNDMSIEHPAGKMMVEVAKTQDSEVGDGTTTAVVIAGGLLERAEKLIDDDIHPSLVIKGYRMAARKAIEAYDAIADPVRFEDTKTLVDIATTSITGKAAEHCDQLAELVVKAVQQVAEEENGTKTVDKEFIKLEKKTGASLASSELIKGIVIDKEVVHEAMPHAVSNAKIALVDSALEIRSPETDAKIQITDPSQLQGFLDQEEGMLRKMVESIKSAGANVLICQKGIDDMAQHFLSKEGILAVRRVKKSDMDALSKSTGGKIITRLDSLTKEDLGYAASVRERKISGDEMVFVEGCKNPKAVTILVRGGTETVVDEAERALVDAIGSVTSALRVGKVVAGGGSAEIEVAMKLREYAKTVGGREQLAITAFAETLEVIPKTLAETAGVNQIDALVNLRTKHTGKQGKYMGIDVYTGKIVDMRQKKVIEPLAVKTQAINSASEVSEMLLRIDDIIAGSSKGGGGGPPGGGMPPGGMGGMPMGDY